MSGWIKLEKDRRDDPRVLRMARELRHAGVTHERFTQNAYVTVIVGCLDVLWCYADSHLREDDTLDLGVDEIDELVGLKGFCGLMPADWLEVLDAQRVKLPDFHTHNGTEAKKKAQGQKRQERKRNADALQEVTQTSRSCVTDALPDQDQTKTKTTKKKPAETQIVFPIGLDASAWQKWIQYRKGIGKSLKPASLQTAVDEFAKFGEAQAAVVNQSIANGYTGLFPIGASNGARGHGAKPSAVETVRRSTAEWAEQRGVDPDSI